MGTLAALRINPQELIRRRRVEAYARLSRALLETQAAMKGLFAAHTDPESDGSLAQEIELLDRGLDTLREAVDLVGSKVRPTQ